jgi:hypothetical protein
LWWQDAKEKARVEARNAHYAALMELKEGGDDRWA